MKLAALFVLNVVCVAQLPDPHLTPGATREGATTYSVCHDKAKQFRHTPQSLKNRVYRNYHAKPHEGICKDVLRMTKPTRHAPGHLVSEGCEVDHLVSLELGGADTERNLFIQPYNRKDGWDAHRKDQLENALHDRVCKTHEMGLREAQKCIAQDWVTCYLLIVGTPFPRHK